MKEFVQFIFLNACYVWNKIKGINIKPTHIIIHSTATPGIMANAWFKRWNKSTVKVAVHAFIDDCEFWQLLPFNMWAWGVGGKANGYSIQIEMCEDLDHSEEYFRKVIANTIKKVAEWCKEFNIPVKNVLGHYEAYLMGIGSNHGDPRHWWSKFGYTMDNFRADVQKEIDKSVVIAEPIKVVKPVTETLRVDGYLGEKTITAMQKYFGTPQDGIISKPSMMVKKLQRLLGVQTDGYMGTITIRALQRRMGTPVDGVISEPSMCIKELQRRLNNNKI